MTPQPPKPVELKSCPFCRKSEEVYVAHNSTGFDGRKLMSVGCCAVIIDYEPTCYERWNTRATPSTHVRAPREPTEKMVNAGHKQYMQDNGIYWERNVYRAMLAAIPQAEGGAFDDPTNNGKEYRNEN